MISLQSVINLESEIERGKRRKPSHLAVWPVRFTKVPKRKRKTFFPKRMLMSFFFTPFSSLSISAVLEKQSHFLLFPVFLPIFFTRVENGLPNSYFRNISRIRSAYLLFRFHLGPVLELTLGGSFGVLGPILKGPRNLCTLCNVPEIRSSSFVLTSGSSSKNSSKVSTCLTSLQGQKRRGAPDSPTFNSHCPGRSYSPPPQYSFIISFGPFYVWIGSELSDWFCESCGVLDGFWFEMKSGESEGRPTDQLCQGLRGRLEKTGWSVRISPPPARISRISRFWDLDLGQQRHLERKQFEYSWQFSFHNAHHFPRPPRLISLEVEFTPL